MRTLLTHIALLCLAMSAWTQTDLVSVALKADRDTLALGDQMELTLSVRYPNELEGTVFLPELSGEMDGGGEVIAYLSQSQQTDPQNASFQVVEHTYLVTSFDTLQAQFGPIGVDVDSARIFSDSIQIAILLPTDSTFKDIMQAENIEFTAEEKREIFLSNNLWWIITAITLLVAGVLLFLYLRRKPKQEEVVVIPAHIKALRELAALRKEAEQTGMADKPFYTALTGIIRSYLEGRYRIRAMEQTTEQILKSLRFSSFPSQLQMNMRELLNIADEVKFAKGSSDEFTRGNALNRVEEMIHNTKPLEEKAEK